MDDVRGVLPEKPVRLLDQIRLFIRQRGLAYKTEQTYLQWIVQFIYFHQKRHPAEMGEQEVEAFLTHLSINRGVTINTQRTALNSLVFLYRQFLDREMRELIFKPASRPRKLPVVLTKQEVASLLSVMRGESGLIASIMYGSGLRVAEAVSLRVRDIDIGNSQILIRQGKGNKDRTTFLPSSLLPQIQKQLRKVAGLHLLDCMEGAGYVYLPVAKGRVRKKESRKLEWQYLFPSPNLLDDVGEGCSGRHHYSIRAVQRAVRQAAEAAEISKSVSCHTLRHSFATALLQQGVSIYEIKELLGHSSVATTMIYTHVVPEAIANVSSPYDNVYKRHSGPNNNEIRDSGPAGIAWTWL